MISERARAKFAEIDQFLATVKVLRENGADDAAISKHAIHHGHLIDEAISIVTDDLHQDYPVLDRRDVHKRVCEAFKGYAVVNDGNTAGVQLAPVRRDLADKVAQISYDDMKVRRNFGDGKFRTRAELRAGYAQLERLRGDSGELRKEAIALVIEYLRGTNPDVPLEIVNGIVEHAFAQNTDPFIAGDASITLVDQWRDQHWKTPEGFTTYPFEEWAHAVGGMPVFDAIAKQIGCSTDEVMTTLAQMTVDDKIRFCMTPTANEPAVFLAKRPIDDGWPEREQKIADALLDAFDKGGEFSTATGKIESIIENMPIVPVADWIAITKKDIGRVCESANLSRRIVESILIDFDARGWLEIRYDALNKGHRVHMRIHDAKDATPTEIRMARAFADVFGVEDNGRIKMSDPASFVGTPPHMKAIEAQYETLAHLASLLKTPYSTKEISGISRSTLWGTDVEILRRADTYCWYPDPQHAAIAAAESLPDDVRVTLEMTVALAGWWYFAEPMPWKTTIKDDTAIALLWSWANVATDSNDETAIGWRGKTGRGIVFSVYAQNGSHLIPSMLFFWKDNLTLAENMANVRAEYTRQYDEGSIGLDATSAVVEQISRFFAAGCLWMQQRILQTTDTAIERHARKRMEREHFNGRRLDGVRVVELRRRQSTAMRVEEPGAQKTVNWSCRWVVSGFWRRQFHPSDGHYSPKWIDPFIKGPIGLPLRTPSHKVFTVKR